MTLTKRILIFLPMFAMVFALLTPAVSVAQNNIVEFDEVEEAEEGVIQNPFKSAGILRLINVVLETIIRIGIIVFTFSLIYVGYSYVAAAGDAQKIQKTQPFLSLAHRLRRKQQPLLRVVPLYLPIGPRLVP